MNKKQHQMDEQEKTAIIELVDTFKNATGLQFVKEGAKWVATGAFMGTSDAVPGYSGGTSISLLGFYRKLILVAKSCFIPEPGITRVKALMFMIPFAIGWIAGVFGFAKLTELMAENSMGLELLFFFSPFIMFTIPVFLKSEKPKLTENKKVVKSSRWIFFFVGFAIILIIGICTLACTPGVEFSKKAADLAATPPGVVVKSSDDPNHFYLGHNLNWLKLIGVAFLAGMVALIPGGSGALIQFLSGMYKNIHWTIMAHADVNMAGLFIFALSTFLGMLTMVFVMAWGLKKYKHRLAALSLGMLIASTGVMFMIPETSMWGHLASVKHYVGIPLAIILGSGCGIGLNLFVKRKQNKINMRKA